MRNVFCFCSPMVVLCACFVLGLPAEAYEVNNLTQLTNGPIQEAEPVFSADGTKIAYRNLHPPYSWANCDIWSMYSDGSSQRRVTTDSRGEFAPSFSPDGRITYAKEFGSNDYNIWIVNPDGSVPHQLIGGSYRQTLCRWHPGGNKVVYQSEYTIDRGEIWTADADGSNKVRLTNHTIDGLRQADPVYSRSGNLIAYANCVASGERPHVWIMNADGSGKQQVTFGPDGQHPMFWWPDDSYIGFVQNSEVWLHNFAADTDELLLSVPGWTIGWADLSPDGTKLTFDLSDGTIGHGHVWIGAIGPTTPANRPPVANAGCDQTVEQEGYEGTEITLDGSGSTDPDSTESTNDDIVSFEWYEGTTLLGNGETIDYTFQLGEHIVTLDVSDSHGETDDDEVTITVVDTTPPTIYDVLATPDVLWPPNHKMVEVFVEVDTEDICDPELFCWILGVSCNEPINGPGDGNTEQDWILFDDEPLVILLRAERAGGADGRVYTIDVVCEDASDNITIGTVDVIVPHDQGKGNKGGKKK